ncbi:alpha-glucuronidase family glycosyl hydrolase [Phenylobacterium sp.]|uniref:alpha-glucuronidase family glycosyl hydrolase n=1 Tax=Phenylobacterium sp. TaxID=1871053 RepID=UPI00391BE6B8
MKRTLMASAAAFLALATAARAEDGYDLWLRYRPVEAARAPAYRAAASELVVAGGSPTLTVAREELVRGLSGMLGAAPPMASAPSRDGALIVGTPASSPLIAGLKLPLETLGPDGYVIRSVTVDGRRSTVIAGNSDVGALYGAFDFLRRMQTGAPIERLDAAEAPKVKLRLLNHWDNLDRHVERGYAGQSIWDWWRLPDIVDARYVDYARANASLGINGTVLNNVNAKADSLTGPYIAKAAAVADVLRPYGIRVYLSARFSAPIDIGGLKTADPLDPAVRAFWRAKADEIYKVIPDFGGFLVKANSEGQPGPQDYGRSHADGANMLAEAVAPHGGVVMWRAFVYSNEQPEDRIKQAYGEFTPLDGKFRDNVIVQVKNGPLDFQPREPFHPLFGATPKTPLMMEFQITKEYLGFATHLVYQGALYEETLRADTWRKGRGSTVAKVVDGSLFGHGLTGMAGVANVGTDRNWSGSHFDQANWYAFGRLAWDPHRSSRAIAREWAKMTFSDDPAFVAAVADMMMASRETVVDYMTPLGLHHLMGEGHHYGPAPWVAGGPRADWTSVYFHRASPEGIGFDRMASGSNAVAQYAPQAGRALAADERNLLWFHRVAWDRKVSSGRTLWDELVVRYDRGVAEVAGMRRTWEAMRPYVDAGRHAEVAADLAVQEREAKWWRDACIAYFQTFSKRPLPAGHTPPEHPLSWYQGLRFPYAPGTGK